MKIRNRLTLLSSLVFGIVFTIASALVYFSFYTGSRQIIINELEKTCRLTALFYLEEDELPYTEHREIRAEFNEAMQGMEARIYDEQNRINFGRQEEDPAISPEILEQARRQKQLSFKAGEYYYCGIFYPDNQGNFVVFVREDNSIFRAQSHRLLLILFVVLIIGLGAITGLSRALSNIAYRPVSQVISQVKELEPESLNKPLLSTGTDDEVQELIETFNNLLKRLNDTFTIQKNFVNYVSHEIKTPLAAIAGNMEVFAQKRRSPEEYGVVAGEVLRNVDNINEIMETLLMISGLKREKSSREKFRLDELLWEVLEKIQSAYPSSSVEVSMDVLPEKEEMLYIRGNDAQIRMAVYNLIENAVKYSPESAVRISLSLLSGQVQLHISDKGIGIPPEELSYVIQPFFRGSNARNIKGSGTGLSVANIIFKANNIHFSLESELNKGTSANLIFPAF
jgi:two-component system sensor histidine kinase ArlS